MQVQTVVNLNDHVWVRLTPEGESQLAHYFTELFDRVRFRSRSTLVANSLKCYESVNGWVEFQLHELMDIFGTRCSLAAPLMFVDNVIALTDPND